MTVTISDGIKPPSQAPDHGALDFQPENKHDKNNTAPSHGLSSQIPPPLNKVTGPADRAYQKTQNKNAVENFRNEGTQNGKNYFQE